MKDALDGIYEMCTEEKKKDEDRVGGCAPPLAGGCAPPACKAAGSSTIAIEDPEEPNQLLQELLTASHVNVDISKKTLEERDHLQKFADEASRLVLTHVELIDEDEREDTMVTALKNTQAGKVRGGGIAHGTSQKYVGIFYDPKVAGESTVRPHLRCPNFRPQHMKKLIGVALKLKDDEGEAIDEGDLYFVCDGGKHGIP